MASTSRGSLCSISPAARWIYDVFLSFRGQDTRKGFTDHLYLSLVRRGIRAFRDDKKLERGKVIAPELSKAIEGSMFSIVVFSRNFAFSTWCLDEVVKIIECMKEDRQTVLPVFYDVDPSHVRKQTGNFGAAFAKFEGSKEKMDKVQRWRDALTEAANLSGWNLHDGYESESKLIKEITEYIFSRLNHFKHLNGYRGDEGCEIRNESFSVNVSFQISLPKGLGDIRMNNSCEWKSNPCGHMGKKVFSFSTFYNSDSPKRQKQNEAYLDSYQDNDESENPRQKPELCVTIEGNFTFSCDPKDYRGDGRKGGSEWVTNQLQLVKSLGSLWLCLIQRGLEDTLFWQNSALLLEQISRQTGGF